jgi:hypothetical protein
METDAEVQQRVSVELPTEPSDAAATIEARGDGADAARSKENILQWMSYLPTDCVNTMIEMGWNDST